MVGGGMSAMPAQTTWEIAMHQLEMQLDRPSFDTYLRNTVLLDFDPATHTFTVEARDEIARDMLQQRLYRNVCRVLSDVSGLGRDALTLTVVTQAEWTIPVS
jgi:hypothetical protein